MAQQPELFSCDSILPQGMVYESSIITAEEERALLSLFCQLPLQEARYKEWHARRRVVSYGGHYDFSRHELQPGDPIPSFLFPLRERIATWSGIPAGDFRHALIAEYSPGTQLGWHRDVPDFESIVGVSLGGMCRMRLRPYPPAIGSARATQVLDLEPRSAYLLAGPVRWKWQHAISPTKVLRYSITLRTKAR
jgi:alkylated DNA repair dioxygenase AlkB